MGEKELDTVYFRRFLVPVVISILVMCLIVVLIAIPPGAGINWSTFNAPFGALAQRGGH